MPDSHIYACLKEVILLNFQVLPSEEAVICRCLILLERLGRHNIEAKNFMFRHLDEMLHIQVVETELAQAVMQVRTRN